MKHNPLDQKTHALHGRYYYVGADMQIHSKFTDNSEMDIVNQITHNCFGTLEGAEEYLEILKTKYELMQYAAEHNDRKIDWYDEGQTKYLIYYSEYEKVIEYHPYIMDKCAAEVIAFTSREVAENAVKEIGADRVIRYMMYF